LGGVLGYEDWNLGRVVLDDDKEPPGWVGFWPELKAWGWWESV
jgi:hypothetical protein